MSLTETVETELEVTDALTRDTRRGRLLRTILAPVIGVVTFLGLWQLLVWALDIQEYLLPAPTQIFRHIASDLGFYVTNARTTLWEAGLGFVIALVLALAAATVMAHYRFIEQAVAAAGGAHPGHADHRLRAGRRDLAGLRAEADPGHHLARVLRPLPRERRHRPPVRRPGHVRADALRRARRQREVFLRLRVPHALPYLFSAARIAVGLALIGAVLGEFFAGVTSGLGYAVKVAQARSLILQLWGSIFVLGFLGAVAVLLVSVLERVVLRWHSSQTTSH